jgi:hypothetical protein
MVGVMVVVLRTEFDSVGRRWRREIAPAVGDPLVKPAQRRAQATPIQLARADAAGGVHEAVF